MLLGRPWIHKIKAITFTLDHSIKFMHKGKIVTINAKDNLTNVCQEAEQFWIPNNLVDDEEDMKKIILQEVSIGIYIILKIDI